MHILFLSHYFPPEVNAPANRTFEHARRWVADGHQVTVITGVPNHPAGRLFPGYQNRWRQEEEMEGIRVIRTWMYLTANEGFLRRTANYVLFALTATFAALRVRRPDIVVATTPQFFCGLAGAAVSRLRRIPFVLEVRDLWPDSIVQLGQVRQRGVVRLLEALERALYRSATGVVVVTRSFVEHVAARGCPRERIAFIPNGIDEAFVSATPAPLAAEDARALEGQYVVGYVGTLGLAHGLRTLIETAALLRDEPAVTIVLIGDGADRALLEREIDERGLKNIRLLGLKPRTEIPAWLRRLDLTLVMLRDLPVFGTVIPSKVFEFLAFERPMILAAPDGEIRSMISQAGAGFVIEPENPKALASAILEIRDRPDEARSRARAGAEWVRAGWMRGPLARRMLDFLSQMARAA